MSILPNGGIPSSLEVTINATRVPTKVGKSPAFDWKAGEFIKTQTGRVKVVEGEEALKTWILKALTTPRGVFDIYSEAFGNEAFKLIGSSLPDSVLFMEIERLCKEALEYDPRIKRVGDFTFQREGDKVFFMFQVEHIDGLSDIKMSVTGV